MDRVPYWLITLAAMAAIVAIAAARVHFGDPQAVWVWCDILGQC